MYWASIPANQNVDSTGMGKGEKGKEASGGKEELISQRL